MFRINRYLAQGMTFAEAAAARRADRERNKVANAEAKARREAAAMHCQCCARAILANSGKIAHHGYERPGSGWQTASCMGARKLPFEVDRSALGAMIVGLDRHLGNLHIAKAETVKEKYPLQHNYETRDRHAAWNCKSIKRYVAFTRDIFEGFKAAYLPYYDTRTFDDFKNAEIASIDSKIRMTEQMISDAQKRYDNWKPTHKRVGTTWQPLEKTNV